MRGKVILWTDSPEGRVKLLEEENQIQDGHRAVLASLMCGGAGVNTIYLEFENTSGEVTPVGFDTSAGAEYFTGLTGSADFVRKPLEIKPVRNTDDSVTFSAVFGNETGFHGLPFGGTGVTSKVCGAALVMASSEDQTQDIVFARKNYDPVKIKTTEQMYISWTVYLD